MFIDSYPLIQYKQYPVCTIPHYLFASYAPLRWLPGQTYFYTSICDLSFLRALYFNI